MYRLDALSLSSGIRLRQGDAHKPPMQLAEDGEKILLRFLVPGLKLEDIDLTVSGHNVNISGHMTPMTGIYHRQERPCGRFRRSVRLGCPVKVNEARAELKAGLLSIVLPKIGSGDKRRIPVCAEAK